MTCQFPSVYGRFRGYLQIGQFGPKKYWHLGFPYGNMFESEACDKGSLGWMKPPGWHRAWT